MKPNVPRLPDSDQDLIEIIRTLDAEGKNIAEALHVSERSTVNKLRIRRCVQRARGQI